MVGDPGVTLHGLGSIASATPGQITHLSSAAYRAVLPDTRASAVILAAGDVDGCPTNALVVDNAYLAFARISTLWQKMPELEQGVHPSACVHSSAMLGEGCRIGPGVVVGAGTTLGEGVWLYANVSVGEGCTLGDETILMANSTLYDDVRLGARCIVHSAAVVGADGFGYTPDETGRMQTIAQLGGVTVGDDVSIGAASTVDRGAIDDTVIEDGVKIDNQVQIGHNCRIGAHSLICGCVGLVGSTTVGRHCVLGGGVGVAGDGPLTLCDGVVASAMTHITSSIDTPGFYSGGTLVNKMSLWKRNALRFQQLDALAKQVRRLEWQLEQLSGHSAAE